MFKVISNINIGSVVDNEYPDLIWHTYSGSDKSFFLKNMQLFIKSFQYDAIVLNCGGNSLLLLCLFKKLIPINKTKIIAVEWNGVKPNSFYGKVTAHFKKIMLRKVFRFILLIKDVTSFERYFGITTEKSEYIPFKVNNIETINKIVPLDSGYVLTCGNRRDYNLVAEAVKELPYPVRFICPPDHMIKSQGTNIPKLDEVSSNVKIFKHDGSYDTWIKNIAECRLLVIPVSDACIYAEGVSTYLEAMALGKCVITTEFEGTRGIISSGEAILVPRGDVDKLKSEIIFAWENEAYRNRIAACGHKYAHSLGGVNEYHKAILSSVKNSLEMSPNSSK